MTSPAVVLEIVDGPAAGRTFRFRNQDSFIVGRAESATLQLADDSHLSRNHLVIEIDPPNCQVLDLSSANGTFVNGERIKERWLVDGDTICGGQTQIRIRIEEGTSDPLASTRVMSDASMLSETMVSDPLPLHVGKWQLHEQIGAGSMGVVHRAVHADTRELAAIKLVAPSVQFDDNVLKTFVREASVLRTLNHKRIVQFIDTGIESGHLFLIMEYVPAIDLGARLSQLSTATRIRVSCGLMRQILDGLEYAHSRGVVHRDVKPGNVLVAEHDRGLRAKLGDFGLAKNFLEAGLSRFSCGNEIKGTLSYMAPEQVANSRYATPRSDIFSVGATLYTLITERGLYDGASRNDDIETILRRGPVPLQQRMPSAPAEVMSIVSKALAYDPADRFESADAMREALTAFVERTSSTRR
jgi:serine/threonine-protein kinase